MKLFLLTLTALLSFGSQKANAQDIKVSAAVVNSFNTSFKNASDVQWKDGGTFYKADFSLNGQYVTAFYDSNANLMAVTKNISPVQLPVTLQASLKKSYEDYWISELFEISDENGTSYYATVEDGDTKTTLKSVGSTWTTFKKQRKS
jgi:post-segregation antitoxin (ccd killing protein)